MRRPQPNSRPAHPRSRGENKRTAPGADQAIGSSPLTRGKRRLTSMLTTHSRLIPAHAGKTCVVFIVTGPVRAHPRSRGENCRRWCRSGRCSGSSPLTRGKPRSRWRRGARGRLIPAHAGKTRRARSPAGVSGAHPRSRGENPTVEAGKLITAGSSPLTRGKLAVEGEAVGVGGLIPAHAGKTLPDLRFYCADRSDLGNP